MSVVPAAFRLTVRFPMVTKPQLMCVQQLLTAHISQLFRVQATRHVVCGAGKLRPAYTPTSIDRLQGGRSVEQGRRPQILCVLAKVVSSASHPDRQSAGI